MNLVQALQYLENLEIYDGSENDTDLEIEHQDVTKIFIQQPIDSNENNSDVDSGDVEDPSIENLNGNQLLAPVSLVVKDVKKVKSMSNKRKTNKRKILVDLIVLTLSQKKEKLFKKLEMERSRQRRRRRKQKKFMRTYDNIRTFKMQMI